MNSLYYAAAIFALLAAIVGLILKKLKKAKKEIISQKEFTDRRKKRELQLELSGQAYERLSKAARENVNANTLDGRKVDGMSLLLVKEVKSNAGSSSIFVSLPDQKSFGTTMSGRGHNVLQMEINVEKGIYVFYGPYGPDEKYDLKQFEEAIRKLENLIRGYRHFRNRAA